MAAENRRSSMEQCITDIAECPICTEVLQDNRCLPCLHMFCLKCLESYRRGKPRGKPLPCPVCRKEFSIPKNITDLPRNFFIDKLLDAHKIKRQDALPKMCEICNEDTCRRRLTSSLKLKHNDIALATGFCSECRQYLCLSCEKQHRRIKAIAWHKIIDSTSMTDSQELTPRPTYCIVHKTKEAEVYCKDCKMVICWQCKALSHSSHDSLDVSNATKDLAAKLEEHIEQISRHLQTKQAHIRELKEWEKLYTDEIHVETDKINREQRKLSTTIALNGDKLKKSIIASTAVQLNAIADLQRKLETDVDELNRHKVYIEQMIHLGNVSDLCEYTDTLILKTARLAEEHASRISIIDPPVEHLSDAHLQDLLTGKRTDIDLQYSNRYMDNTDISNEKKSYPINQLPPPDVSNGNFEDKSDDYKSQLQDEQSPTNQLTGSLKVWQTATRAMIRERRMRPSSMSDQYSETNENKFKKLSFRQMKVEDSVMYKDWSLSSTTISSENNRAVCGITVLSSMLYVLTQDSNKVSVYSTTDLMFLIHLSVYELVNPNDIVSCKFSNCLYICDWGRTARIFRVKVGENMGQINWSTDKDIGCLSVTTEHTILLAGYISSKLKEYTTDGELLRSIDLANDLKPWHAIRLGRGNTHYLICQGDRPTGGKFHRVCLIDFNGEVKNTFGGVAGRDHEHLCGPYHLAVDKSGCILVNDCNNSRILLLNQDLRFIKEIIPSSANVIRRARRMYLDEIAGRLYVADNDRTGSETQDGRILVFVNSGAVSV